jgi:hypothetical protein
MKKYVKQWLSRVVRFAAREWADEVGSQKSSSAPDPGAPMRIDVPDAIRQLASPASRLPLQHVFVWNHKWIALLSERNRRNAVSTYDFIDKVMPHNARFDIDQFAVIENKKKDILELDGHILDLGVWKGDSSRALARIFPERAIHGFDSFEGLPEDWGHLGKGHFGEVKGTLPDVPANVQLFKGWFDETLPAWRDEHADRPISLLRVDCDLYSSTKTALAALRPLIRPGTWIVFDELIGYRGWEAHEYKAFMEFIDETGFEYEYIAYGLTYTIVRLR